MSNKNGEGMSVEVGSRNFEISINFVFHFCQHGGSINHHNGVYEIHYFISHENSHDTCQSPRATLDKFHMYNGSMFKYGQVGQNKASCNN